VGRFQTVQVSAQSDMSLRIGFIPLCWDKFYRLGGQICLVSAVMTGSLPRTDL